MKFIMIAVAVICFAVACKTNNGAASVDTTLTAPVPIDTNNLQSSTVDSLHKMQQDSLKKDSIKN